MPAHHDWENFSRPISQWIRHYSMCKRSGIVWKSGTVVWHARPVFYRDDGADGTNSLRIPRANSMLFFASFSARRALTSSKPSVTSRLKFMLIVLLICAESTLDVALTAAWCLAGRSGADPSGKLVQWPDDTSWDAFLQCTKTLNAVLPTYLPVSYTHLTLPTKRIV